MASFLAQSPWLSPQPPDNTNRNFHHKQMFGVNLHLQNLQSSL